MWGYTNNPAVFVGWTQRMSAIAYLKIKKPILYVEKFKTISTYLVQADSDVYTWVLGKGLFIIAKSQVGNVVSMSRQQERYFPKQ